MAIRNLIFVVLFFISLSSCIKRNYYSLDVIYDGNSRYSYVILSKNSKNIDSIRIMDYYGTSKIEEIEDSTWHVTHKERCGTDCSMKKQYIFKVKNGTIVNSLELPLSYEDIELKDTLFIGIIKKDELRLIHYTFYNVIDESQVYNKKIEYILYYDKFNKIYYNDSLIYKGEKYKTISVDDGIYPFVNNIWGYFKKDSIYIENKY